MKLSILICTTPDRRSLFESLLAELNRQIIENNAVDEVEILHDETPAGQMTIGDKSNLLLERATGDYLCRFDSDDRPSKDYIETLLKGIETEPDCISLRGVITWNGERPEVFEHSIRYKEYKTNKTYRTEDHPFIKYERYPNHLNCIKASIAKQFKFPSSNFGEDTDWATQLYNSGLLKNEYYTDNILYQYLFKPNK